MTVKEIHRFWAGDPMPEEYRLYGRQWEELNPDWYVTDWEEDDVESLVEDPEIQKVISNLYSRDAPFRGIELFVQLADVMGYVLVERFGGVYVNCDIQPLRPIEELPLPDRAWASKENDVDDRIVNAAIGAPEPHDQFWHYLLHDLPYRYFNNPTAEMVETTGPALLTDQAHLYPNLLHVFPTKTFNPIHWSQIQEGGDATGFSYPEESIAVHHWGHKKDRRSNHVETGTQRP